MDKGLFSPQSPQKRNLNVSSIPEYGSEKRLKASNEVIALDTGKYLQEFFIPLVQCSVCKIVHKFCFKDSSNGKIICATCTSVSIKQESIQGKWNLVEYIKTLTLNFQHVSEDQARYIALIYSAARDNIVSSNEVCMDESKEDVFLCHLCDLFITAEAHSGESTLKTAVFLPHYLKKECRGILMHCVECDESIPSIDWVAHNKLDHFINYLCECRQNHNYSIVSSLPSL